MTTATLTTTAEVNEELTGTLDQVEELLTFASESLDASDDATVKVTAPAIAAYAAKIREMLAALEASVAERTAE
jgi:hypothetical protein